MTIRGISFPFRKSLTSFPAVSQDDVTIEENIVRILQTAKGARVMRPTAGSNVLGFVFENTGPVLTARIDHEVRRAIAEGEPRAIVLNVGVSEEERDDGGINLVVTITYRVNLDVRQVSTSFSQATSG
jgi:phage baseplate assembly protein W